MIAEKDRVQAFRNEVIRLVNQTEDIVTFGKALRVLREKNEIFRGKVQLLRSNLRKESNGPGSNWKKVFITHLVRFGNFFYIDLPENVFSSWK